MAELPDPYTEEWQLKANRLARCYIAILQCQKCGDPYVSGYCCGSCKTRNPDWTVEKEKAWENKYGKQP